MPKLEWAFLAADATGHDGVVDVAGGGLSTIVVDLPPQATVSIVFRVEFDRADIGREHRFIGTSINPEGDACGEGRWETPPIYPQADLDGPTRGLYVVQVPMAVSREGNVRFRLWQDDDLLTDDLVLRVRSRNFL